MCADAIKNNPFCLAGPDSGPYYQELDEDQIVTASRFGAVIDVDVDGKAENDARWRRRRPAEQKTEKHLEFLPQEVIFNATNATKWQL